MQTPAPSRGSVHTQTQVHMGMAGEDRGCPFCPRPPGLPIYQPLSIKNILTPSLFPSESRFQGRFQISLISVLVH